MRKIILFTLVFSITLVVADYEKASANFPKPTKKPIALDVVNLGDPTSETGHNLEGWGPIEPDTHGGNWGNISGEAGCDLPEGMACDKKLRTAYATDEPDHPEIKGRMASVTLKPEKKSWGLMRGVEMRVLDGIGNDDFLVFAKDKFDRQIMVSKYISDESTAEKWVVHNFQLEPKFWLTPGPIELTIMATGSDWEQKKTYGQLGVDWIKLYGVGCGICNGDKD